MYYILAKKFCFLSVFCVMAFFSFPAFAQVIGSVSKINGDVVLIKDGQKNALDVGSSIHLGDTVETAFNSKVEISFIDKTIISLAADSSLTIDKYVFDPKNVSSNAADYNFTRGGFSYVSGLIAKRQDPDVNLRTMFGSIGIRGTKVWGGMLDKECRIYIEDGAIEVTNKHGSVNLIHGEGTRILNEGEAPKPVEFFSVSAVRFLKNATAF